MRMSDGLGIGDRQVAAYSLIYDETELREAIGAYIIPSGCSRYSVFATVIQFRSDLEWKP